MQVHQLTGGVIDEPEKCAGRCPVFEPTVVAAIDLDQFAHTTTLEPLRGDILVEPCQPNPASSILRFSRLAEFVVPGGDGKNEAIQLYDPVIVHANSKYMEVHGYERGDDGFYMQSWILRPTLVDTARSSAAHFHTGQPGHPGHEGAER